MIVITTVYPHCHAPFVSHSSSPLVLSGRGPDPEGVRDAGGPVDPQRGYSLNVSPETCLMNLAYDGYSIFHFPS